jgi:V/A-type H+-transporting ATPase subunit F
VIALSSRKGVVNGKIAVVGDRELVLGYRLLGVEDTFSASGGESVKLLTDLLSTENYSLIVISASVRRTIPQSLKERLEASIVPLVVFLPDLKTDVEEEPLAALARRVLGVDLKVGGK